MNKTQIKQLNKKIDEILSLKKSPIFPIYGGLSSDPSELHESSRNVTPQEAAILISRRQPVPVCIALNREKAFLEYLKDENGK